MSRRSGTEVLRSNHKQLKLIGFDRYAMQDVRRQYAQSHDMTSCLRWAISDSRFHYFTEPCIGRRMSTAVYKITNHQNLQ